MPYVLGDATVTIHSDGRRAVTTANLRVMPGDKPRTLEASGSDPAVWARIRAGEVGRHETLVHVGDATGLIVRRSSIALEGRQLISQLEEKFGALGSEALLGAVRTGAAAATQFVVDTVGAMSTTGDRTLDRLLAMVKILVFKPDGWVRIMLPAEFARYQDAFDEAQRKRWSVARPGFTLRHEARITFRPTGKDLFDGECALVVPGPIGDLAALWVAHIELEGEDNHLCDGEWRPGKSEAGEDELVPLRRKIVATVQCGNNPGKPLILELHPEGYMAASMQPILVDAASSASFFSHNPDCLLRELGWLK